MAHGGRQDPAGCQRTVDCQAVGPALRLGGVRRRFGRVRLHRDDFLGAAGPDGLTRHLPTGPFGQRATRNGQLPAGKKSRQRRDGRGVDGQPPHAGPAGGGEVHQARRAGRNGAGAHRHTQPALRARGAGHGNAAVPAYGRNLRLRHHSRRHLLLRDGTARGHRHGHAGKEARTGRAREGRAPAAADLPLAAGADRHLRKEFQPHSPPSQTRSPTFPSIRFQHTDHPLSIPTPLETAQ